MRVKSKKKLATDILFYAVLIIFSLILLLPFISLLSASFKTFEQVLLEPASLLPKPFVFDNYGIVIKEQNYIHGLGISLMISSVTTLGTVLSSAFVAYAFSRFSVKEKEAIFSILMMGVMIPGQVLQISMYALYVKINWINTFLPLILPAFLGGGILNVFLIRQFFTGVPKSLFEAAEIDGGNELRIFATVAIPLSAPILLTVGLFTFVGAWNDFMGPLLYLGGKEELYPLALLMYNMNSRLKIGDAKQWNIISAANVLMMLPTIILYGFMQKYFQEGIAVSGLKD